MQRRYYGTGNASEEIPEGLPLVFKQLVKVPDNEMWRKETKIRTLTS
jgi:hypothetical protein